MPVGVNKKKHDQQLYTPKLWLFLVGVNQYNDEFPSLRYPALDCQGLTEALTVATQYPQKEVINYHDFGNLPLIGAVCTSLKYITEQARSEDTILFYFSGHGILDPTTQQCFLCLRDTQKDDLVNTSLPLQELLLRLAQSAARQQLIWLDACHSGGMTLRGTEKLVQVLQGAAAASKGFYALLSCDINQQSWEFPELGHGVFTYYLMRGLRGEAANPQGVITADELYRYVYHQTLQYIDKTNQQLRLINQQRRFKGDCNLQHEYPLQTPKRIVEGVGDVILANAGTNELVFPRVALVIEGMTNSNTLSLSKTLRGICGFELEYLPRSGKITTKSIRDGIQSCLRLPTQTQEATTALLYLRGRLQETPAGDLALSLSDDVWLSRDWLRLQLRRSSVSQLILILDCLVVEPKNIELQEWIEDLQVSTDKGLCIIAGVTSESLPEAFVTALINTLQSTPQSLGLSVAGWISQLQLYLAGALPLHIWLSGTRGIIEIIPSTTGASSKPTNIDLNICPYLGLRAFSEEDAQYFYGRESLIQNLISHITTQSFLAVVGASGSGKSSVVQAGLIAQLRLGKQLPGSEKWLIKSIRPGARPLQLLARLSDNNANVLEGLLYQGVEGFVYWLRSCPATVVLIIDQFEELFTLAPDSDREEFLKLVLGALQYASDKFKLVITLRADFMAPCLEIPTLAQLLQSSSVLVSPSLSDDDYRNVIIKPAEQVGLKVQTGLVEVLLQELSHSASDLPLLEFVLEQLWEKRIDGELTLAVYQQHLGGIAGALERRAQAVYDNLDSAAQKCARWIFLSLTQLGEGTEDTRRRVLKSDLAVKKYPPEQVERTLQALTAAKLIVINTEQELVGISKNDNVETRYQETRYIASLQPITIEVAHEILIRHWSTLRWWLEENRNRLRLQRQIEQAAQLWKHNHEQTEFLLQGVRLAEAEEIYIKYTDELSSDVQTFIAACLDEHRRLQLEQKKRLRQTQAALAVISILGVAATFFGGFAYFQRTTAQTREVTALNASSEALLNSHSQLEAIIASLKASKQLKQILVPGQDIRLATAATLQQALSLTQEINRLQAHTDKVNAVSFSPDNKLIATASDDNTVKIWRRDGRLVNTFKNHQDRVTSVIFSHDSKYIASGGADKTIQLNSIDGKVQKTFIGHNDFVTSLAFSPDSKTLVSGSRDKTIRIWSLDSNSRIINAHNGWVNTVAVDSRYIVSGGEDNLIKLWQVTDRKLVKTFTGHKDRVNRVIFSYDGQNIASASDDSTIKIWNLNGKELQSFTTQANSIFLTTDSSTLVSGSTDGSIKLWQLDGKLITTYQGHDARVTDISISRDGIIVSSSDDKTVRLWNLAKPNTKNHTIYSVAFNPDAKTFATAGWDGAVNILDNNQKLDSTFKAHQNIISAIAYNPNTKILATASADKSVKLWNIKTKQLIQTLSGHSDRVTSVAFTPDNNIIATAGADKTVKLWRVKDGKLLNTLTGHSDEVTSVAISTNGLIASGSNDNKIKIWRQDGNLIKTLPGHGSAVSSLAFTPDGQILASASWDNTIKLWHSNGEFITTLTGHNDGVTSLSFTRDNQILASGSADNTIKLWNLGDNTLIKTLSGYLSQINSISFSPNNKALITGGDTGVTLWNLDIDNLIEQSCARVHDYLRNNRDISSTDKKICQQ
ncbi:WD-40 repeat protein [Calothrix sp. NIES-4071]|nr:WD-40 repeat protein [Calothrix sp. NIES-4071]BAZ54446.1 WD-40 repeat protein [Calothrix sp. NIES-4105]